MAVPNPAPDPWPPLSSEAFAPTRHLVHMLLQAVGKLKLAEPFQAQWSEVPLWFTGRGVSTGAIHYAGGAYEVRADFVSHEVNWATSTGETGQFALGPMSVADAVAALLDGLRKAGVDPSITMMPQEIPGPIAFDQDVAPRPYDRDLVNNWWRIMLSTLRVMREFEGRFTGKLQPIGLMWGTLDIRAVFYNGDPATPAPDAGYIRRNAMNAALIEMGWWSGDTNYTRPAFYGFTYPQPPGIERRAVAPAAARWDSDMGEFLLDYDDLTASDDPDGDLLRFMETTYAAGAEAAKWDPKLLGSGRPV